MDPIRKVRASETEILPSFLCRTLPIIAFAKIWNRSVPTARIPFTPALIRAGAIIKPPPAPMHPVISPAATPTPIEARNMVFV